MFIAFVRNFHTLTLQFLSNGNVAEKLDVCVYRRSNTDNDKHVETAKILQDSFGALMPTKKLLTMKLIKII